MQFTQNWMGSIFRTNRIRN